MGRLQLFELDDHSWIPQQVRDTGIDFIQFFVELGNAYQPILSRLQKALMASGCTQILNLCSGGGGPVVDIQRQLAEGGCVVQLTLSDRYPNQAAFEYAHTRATSAIDFIREPLEVTTAPAHLAGFRTFSAALHHFRPAAAQRVLQATVNQHRPLAVFEITKRTLKGAVGPLFFLIGVLLATPFIRSFRWSCLFWTYIIPIVPFYTAWDGYASTSGPTPWRNSKDRWLGLAPTTMCGRLGGSVAE